MKPICEAIELERRILKGIAMEWRSAAFALRHNRDFALRMPGFELCDMSHTLGKWLPDKHVIVLSRRFALEHSWQAVRDVLLHEMAHQLTDEVLGGDSALHGGVFKRACGLLGARPEASGTFAALSEAADPRELPENDRILLRVQKLLAMAQSSNRHEAEVAMGKAQEHIARYNVDLLALAGKDRAYCSVCVGEPALRRSLDEYVLAGLLRDFHFVECIWIPAYVVDKEEMGKILEVSGTTANVKMGSYVHAFMTRAIGEQWTAFNRDRRLSAGRQTDFALGLLQGFLEKLRAQEKTWEQNGHTPYALIRKKDAGLNQYVRQRYPHLRRCGGSGRQIHQDVHAAGVEAGRRTILHKPIEHARGARGLLIRGPGP